jgi:hypothetical protein
MRSNAGMANRQGDVDLRFARLRPQLTLWLGLAWPENLPSFYRPIILSDTIGKIFEKILLARILHEVNKRGLTRDEQFDFRTQALHVLATGPPLQLRFPVIFLSCKANARVTVVKLGHGHHSPSKARRLHPST